MIASDGVGVVWVEHHSLTCHRCIRLHWPQIRVRALYAGRHIALGADHAIVGFDDTGAGGDGYRWHCPSVSRRPLRARPLLQVAASERARASWREQDSPTVKILTD